MKRLLFFVFIVLVIIFILDWSEFFAPFFTNYADSVKSREEYKTKLNQLSVIKPITKKNVNNIFGKPLSSADKNINCDYYSQSKNNWSDFFGWEAIWFCYDKSETVTTNGRTIFFN